MKTSLGKRFFFKIHKIQEVRLKWMQMRIVHRILATNAVLEKMNVVTHARCTFCDTEKDSIRHLFWECEYVKRFWNRLEMLLKDKCAVALNVKFTEKLVLFGLEQNFQTDTVFDYIVLEAKSFVYKCKLNKCTPCLSTFKEQLSWKYKMAEFNAKVNFNLSQFDRNWCCYKALFDGNQ